MDDYIKRVDAILICGWLRDRNAENADMAFALNWAAESISRIPAADARPAVRGESIPKYETEMDTESGCVKKILIGFICPFCGDDGVKAFCPHCGADLRQILE